MNHEPKFIPLTTFIDAGIGVSINTDDPSFTRSWLGDEYLTVQHFTGFSTEKMLSLSTKVIDQTFLDDCEKASLARTFLNKIEKVA